MVVVTSWERRPLIGEGVRSGWKATLQIGQDVDLFGGEWIVGSGAAEGCIIVPTIVYQGDKRGYYFMERTPLHLEDYIGKLNEALASHPECLPGMQIIIRRPELKYSYEICDPTRDPTKPGSLQERMKADRVFKEVTAKVNEKYELIRP